MSVAYQVIIPVKCHGDYRVIYSFDAKARRITIHKVGHRRDIYS